MPKLNKANAIMIIVREADKPTITSTAYKRCKRALEHLGVRRSQAKAILNRLDFFKETRDDEYFAGVESNMDEPDLQ